MNTSQATPPCVITLEHEGAEDHVLTFDERERIDDVWLERVVFLPATPQRVIGFVHPSADQLVGTKPFVLHAAFAFYSNIVMRPAGPRSLEVLKGPQAIVPCDMISPIDMWIGVCSSWVWVHRQSTEWKDAMKVMLLRNLLPDREPAVAPRRVRRRPGGY